MRAARPVFVFPKGAEMTKQQRRIAVAAIIAFLKGVGGIGDDDKIQMESRAGVLEIRTSIGTIRIREASLMQTVATMHAVEAMEDGEFVPASVEA